MGENKFYKNITRTVVTIGLSTALINNSSSTVLINGGKLSMNNDYCLESTGFQMNNNVIQNESNNIFVKGYKTPLEKEAFENFGDMRDATMDEIDGVQQYVNSISKPTGVNFFDLC
ncbi:MAG: hypothetical protein RSE41_10260 [Clostridia bacterium]